MKIALFGGTFDPVHAVHLQIAQSVLDSGRADWVLFIPAPCPPHKTKQRITPYEVRKKMLETATEGNPSFIVSDLERFRPGKSYTIDTLNELSEIYPEDELYFIMGGDSLDYFETWMRPDVIARTAIILVMVRENFPKQQMEEKIAHIKNLFPADIRLLSCDRIDVSSTQVRSLLRAKSQADGYRSPKGAEMFLDAAVMSYIQANNLYR